MSDVSAGASAPVPSVFSFESQSVRVVLDEQRNPLFCAADVCDVLGYSNSRDAIAKHCREAGVAKRDIRSGNQSRELTFLTEGNLYRLILKSHKSEAERFEGWVCDEVLPTIRKTGRYEAPQPELPKRGRPKSQVPATPIPVALPGYGSWLVDAAPQKVQMFEAPNKIRVHSEQTKTLRHDFQTVIDAMKDLHTRMAVLEGEASPKRVERPLQIQFMQQPPANGSAPIPQNA